MWCGITISHFCISFLFSSCSSPHHRASPSRIYSSSSSSPWNATVVVISGIIKRHHHHHQTLCSSSSAVVATSTSSDTVRSLRLETSGLCRTPILEVEVHESWVSALLCDLCFEMFFILADNRFEIISSTFELWIVNLCYRFIFVDVLLFRTIKI